MQTRSAARLWCRGRRAHTDRELSRVGDSHRHDGRRHRQWASMCSRTLIGTTARLRRHRRDAP